MRKVFIIAQYKCGTSWLLSALSAHPFVLGVREIDIIKGSYDWRHSADVAPVDDRLRSFFASSAWCSDDIRDDLAREVAPSMSDSVDHSRPQSYRDLSAETLLRMYAEIRDATSAHDAVRSFLEAVETTANAETHLVLKAADQIVVLDLLDQACPDGVRIAITRDGRDAAISALHYRKLVESQPWFGGHAPYTDLLEGWAGRARRIASAAEAGRVHVIRYEDLTIDFVGTMASVLRLLDVDDSEALIHQINEKTSFESITGRQRGTEGSGVVRKGGIGEWQEFLSDSQADEAWGLAGDPLEMFGYTRHGAIEPLPRSVRPALASES